jgi:hypothetical protein
VRQRGHLKECCTDVGGFQATWYNPAVGGTTFASTELLELQPWRLVLGTHSAPASLASVYQASFQNPDDTCKPNLALQTHTHGLHFSCGHKSEMWSRAGCASKDHQIETMWMNEGSAGGSFESARPVCPNLETGKRTTTPDLTLFSVDT